MEKNVREPAQNYAVKRGELLVNGLRLAVSPQCIRLCLLRHGLDPWANHERLPAQVGRHILRISSFILTCAMERFGDPQSMERRSPR